MLKGPVRLTVSPVGAWQPDLLYDRLDGNLYLTWADMRFNNGDIAGEIFNWDGYRRNFRIASTPGYSQFPKITMDPVTGQKWVTWEEISPDPDNRWRIKTARFPTE
jgi:hypothetical protein